MIANFVEKHDSLVHRLLEMSLGIMTWSLLTSPIWLGILFPEAIVYMLTFFTVYWSYMAAKHTYGMVVGYSRYQKELSADWLQECKNLDFSTLPDRPTLPPSFEETKFFLLIPLYSESENVVRGQVEGVLSQTFPLKQVTLIYAIEEKFSDVMIDRVKSLMGDRLNDFEAVRFYIHPAGISGEAKGVAGANRTWGAKHAVEDLIKEGKHIRNYIFATVDGDHVISPQYLSRIAHLYLTTDRRDYHFYSTAVHLFDNNLWRVPVMMRIEANAVTLGSIADWVVTKREVKDSFSAYAASLQTLIDAGYWDVQLGIDDTIFYWRAFFARDGDFDGVCHYIPYSADAVEGKDFIDSHVSMYKQLLRWGWGAIDFPLSVKEFLKNNRIPMRKKIYWIIAHLKKRVILINIVFMITFGFGIVTMVNPYVKQSNFAYSLPDLISAILTITLIFLIPGSIYRNKMVAPMPKDWPLWRKFLVILEGPLIILNLLTYSFIPWIDAQTRMLLGKKMKDLYHTPKLR